MMYRLIKGKKEQLREKRRLLPRIDCDCLGKPIEIDESKVSDAVAKKFAEIKIEITYKRAILEKLEECNEFDETELVREIAPGEKMLEFDWAVYRHILDELRTEGLVEYVPTRRVCGC